MKDPLDPRDLIAESYRIEGITAPECRSIFLDWAMGLPDGQDAPRAIAEMLARHRGAHPAHPMTEVLSRGLDEAAPPRRRGGRAGRTG
ncbi:hypothetical protein [Wenxinia saemankumensis]|uniref:Uncharacterized protein n=1 Tax=Wenxinia saemankumensis TaxID=1447782 RepID=A0A1M6AHT3_9RHOB|nr:hypothetical protein [Wenxinia saemankumensis]SHI36056.1 hypothetical protein SAMN05444417_0442 [Wenxinia saemankumensis]